MEILSLLIKKKKGLATEHGMSDLHTSTQKYEVADRWRILMNNFEYANRRRHSCKTQMEMVSV